jgi:hypothetical protein
VVKFFPQTDTGYLSLHSFLLIQKGALENQATIPRVINNFVVSRSIFPRKIKTGGIIVSKSPINDRILRNAFMPFSI